MSELDVSTGESAQAIATSPAPALWLSGVERRYTQGEATLEILKGADFALWPGTFS